ncbi:MAG: 50S ribosomal protein L3 N(5)-glutamine methyltransferase [Halofilum sp. (in: g-proteobacteria)]|nr:50S ribosomal protein L3 N(5)-glutamine methyltransferase [Halofilum sp. (in: g-proteobacteria)]
MKIPQAPATLLALVDWAEARLAAAPLAYGHGTDNPRDEAAWLVLAGAGYAPDDPSIDPEVTVDAAALDAIDTLVRRRIDERRPTAYLTGRAWFAGLPFRVNEHVLVPRSPLAEPIAARFAPWIGERPLQRILEIGTGCGCIAAACAQAFPEARVDATDIDAEALALAAANLAELGLNDRVVLHKADLFDGLPPARYDLIVTNPPYVDHAAMEALPAEYRHEPGSALAAGADGLDVIRPLLMAAGDWLAEDGLLVVETGRAGVSLTRYWPRLPVTWLEFDHGGDGVFAIEAEALREHDFTNDRTNE